MPDTPEVSMMDALNLIVDEVDLEPMNRADAALFFRLVSYRYLRGSTAVTAVTTNKSVKDS